MYTYQTQGTCSKEIEFDIQDGVIRACSFIGGCSGNLQGLCKLVIGKPVEEVAEMLSGIPCRNGTSCPDQLSKALKRYLQTARA